MWGRCRVSFGSVDVSNQVTSYLRRRSRTGEVIDETPLDLPVRTLRTSAVWWTVPDDVLEAAGLLREDLPGAAHAAEHCSIGLLPLFATCDRWDIGGVSTARHPDTGVLTVFVHDGHPGGAGFAERGYATAREWLTATRADHRRLRVRQRLSVLHPVAQVRQRQRPARQGRRGAAARRVARSLSEDWLRLPRMVIFGLVLVALGAVIVVLGLFTSEVKFEDNEATVEIANVNLSTEGLFLAGVIAAALILVGLWAIKLGAKMGWKHRKEQKRLNELSEKLDKVELDRRRKEDEDDATVPEVAVADVSRRW